MKSFEDMEYHPTAEKLVEVLCAQVQNDNPLFFRILVAYYFSVVASNMRCTIASHDRGNIPINLYAANLAGSGFGKGHSTYIVEKSVIHLFKKRFIDETYPLLAEESIARIANSRALRSNTDPDEMLMKVTKEFESLGPFVFSFDSGSSPAVKQQRHKHLMAEAGALSFKVDEIGLNLTNSQDIMGAFLELYDKGDIGQKLTKNFADNKRVEEIDGAVPANMMMFGEPTSLLNGGKTEDDFMSMLSTGYARRCLFGYIPGHKKTKKRTPQEIYTATTNKASNAFLEELADKLERLADMINANKKLVMSMDAALLIIEYRLQCEEIADTYADHEGIKKAEMCHRYFKVLKLAGAYAFVDDSPELTTEHLYHAIKLAEEAGASFSKLLARDRPYVKLAKYIAAAKQDVTQADMSEDLSFYKGGTSIKGEMVTQAIAWGYRNNIIIKRTVTDGIEFLRGESLKETDLSKLRVSYSSDITSGYQNVEAPFEKLHQLTQAPGMHWLNHHLVNGYPDPDGNCAGYRNEENCLPGFNMLVLDVDGSIQLSVAKALLKDYRALYYTTKRSTDDVNRFRILLPINYELNLDNKDYKELYKAVEDWVPFKVDEQCSTRSKKWMTHTGHFEYNDGAVFDILPFIPKTSKNEERKAKFNSQSSLDSLERWLINNVGDGNRNNLLLRYAMVLIDAGLAEKDIESKVKSLNDKIPDKLSDDELRGTILLTVARTLAKRP